MSTKDTGGAMSELEQFIAHGMEASFHFADDSGREWSKGRAEQEKALAVFDSNPDLHFEMREAAKGFLWFAEFQRARPESEEPNEEAEWYEELNRGYAKDRA